MLGAYLARRIQMFGPSVGSEPEIEDVDDAGRGTPRLRATRSGIDILDFVFSACKGHHDTVTDRAVAVAFHDDEVLVMRRHRDGRDYCVLPGGGVEDGEQPRQAVVRELLEETGLSGSIDRHLQTIEHQDRSAHYFLLRVPPGPMTVGGPEAKLQTDQNSYHPEWLSLDDLEANNLQPEEIRQLLIDIARPSSH